MTPGQHRAVCELERLYSVDQVGFDFRILNENLDGWVDVELSLRIGLIETRPGGLSFREREEFRLLIPPDFPFAYPSLRVTHRRFAGFPHVNWATNVCLYQSMIEWNPSDGLYGFFDRLKIWIGRAAINDMDPAEGPLHPPVHIPDNTQIPFVIRANSPVEPGKSWLGLVELEKFRNRIELVRWNDLNGEWPDNCLIGLAVVLPEALPIEFPKYGKDFFAELINQNLDKQRVLRNLRIAALLTPKDDPAYIVLAMPMRRSADGTTRHHIAVWVIDPINAQRLRTATPSVDDHSELAAIKSEMNDLIYSIFELTPIKWCPVMEDRSEIIVRRDKGRPVSWMAGKKVLVLGCGALGSWAAEIVARANPCLIHLVDNSIVKPGLLARQNFRLEDIGSNKANALKCRIQSIAQVPSIEDFAREAHQFLIENQSHISDYDIILDCTASSIFQMKIERDWNFIEHCTPPIVSLVIDATAHHCLGIILGPNSRAGIWDAFVQLKQRLCLDGNLQEIVSAFYSEHAAANLFQPEPGCSDPTFSGSTADVFSLVSTALNLALTHIPSNNTPVGIAFSAHGQEDRHGGFKVIKLMVADEIQVGHYKVRINPNIYREARAWVHQNTRKRSRSNETGGLLWGLWDEAIGVVWVFDASGPPPDSLHSPGHFICGVEGTVDEHKRRSNQSRGAHSFIGFWHTHPDMPSEQSGTDIHGMAGLTSVFGSNQKKSLMLIFGRTIGLPTVGAYIYESHSLADTTEVLSVGMGQIELETSVV